MPDETRFDDYAALRQTSRVHRDGFLRRTDMVVELLARVRDRAETFRLLDVGTADGIMLGWLQAAFSGASFEGLEASEELAATARANGWAVTVARAEALPFDPETFDVVTVVSTLKHVPEAGRALQEFRRVLRAGGHLVVADPTPFGVRLGRLRGHFDPRYLPNVWSLRETRRRVEAAGFAVRRALRYMPAPVHFPGSRAIERVGRAVGLSGAFMQQAVLAEAVST